MATRNYDKRKIVQLHRSPVAARSHQLNHYYVQIGCGLAEFERAYGFFSEDSGEFQLSVAFVPTEVLESYLEDLLNPRVTSASLAIEEGQRHIGWLGLCSSLIVTGVFIAALCLGVAPLSSLVAAVVCSAPVILVWLALPRVLLARRMRYARIVSKEITRRRGKGRTAGIGVFVFDEWMRIGGTSSAACRTSYLSRS